MRKTVTVSLSVKPETYEKIMKIKTALEAERMEQVHMSTLVDRLINLGIAYRELLADKEFKVTHEKEKKW